MNQPNIRETILQIITEQTAKYQGNLQSGSVLAEARTRLRAFDICTEQAILTSFHDLFRTGYLAWRLNLSNPDPPFFHITEQGRRSLTDYSRDPANPDGYLANVRACAALPAIADSYLGEGVKCFASDFPKAAAVMVGAAAESLILDLRDAICARSAALGHSVPRGLSDWKIKSVLDGINSFLSSKKPAMPRILWEATESYWPAFTQQIRSARNDAGHPVSIDPVTIDTVHASLLIFPELVKLWISLRSWVANDYA